MKTYLLRSLLILTFAAEIWAARAQTLSGDNLYLYPTTPLPLTCNTGSVRFDGVAGTLKVCVLNAWIAAGGSFSSPMTTDGDIIYRNSTTAARLGIGTANTVLTAPNGTPAWAAILNANIDPAAGITYSKLNLTGQLQNADVASTAAIAYSKLNLTASIVGSDVSTAAALTVATIQTNSFANFIGAVTAASTLNVTGATNFVGVITAASTLSVTGNASFAGSIRAANGSATAPSIAFTNDTATGIYRIGALDWGVAVGGVTAIDILENSGFLTWGFGTTASSNVDFPLRWAMTDNTDVTYEMFNNSTGNASSVQFVFQDGVTSGQYLSFQSYRSNYTPKTYLANSGWIRTGFNQTALVLGTEYTSGRVEFVFSQTPSSTTEYAFMTTASFGLEKGMSLGLGGSTSGTVSVVTSTAAGSYNFWLPTTAGTAGQVLLSGGGTSPITYGSTLTNPATAAFDLLYQNTANTTLANLPNATATGMYLKATASAAPSWATFTPHTQTIKTTTGTTTGFRFFVSSVTAAAVNATYTNNSNTYTVIALDGAHVNLWTTGAGTPLSSGNLIKSSGTGDGTIAFTGSTALASYTAPATAKTLWVRAVGGGGGGGGTSSTASTAGAGGGGGSGGYVEKLITTPASVYYYEIGAGGGGNTSAAGTAGNKTSFLDNVGGVLIYANGGGAGNLCTATAGPAVCAASVDGGAGFSGDVNLQEGSGKAGIVLAVAQAMSGEGGSNPLGFGGRSNQGGSATGNAGNSYGGGGAGGVQVSNGGVQAGGAGAAGVIVIEELYNGN